MIDVYYCNEEKGVVVAKIENVHIKIARTVAKKLGVFYLDVYAIMNKMHIIPVIIGKAKCCPEDTFDESFGERLASDRARETYFHNMARVYCEFIKYHSSKIDLAVLQIGKIVDMFMTWEERVEESLTDGV